MGIGEIPSLATPPPRTALSPHLGLDMKEILLLNPYAVYAIQERWLLYECENKVQVMNKKSSISNQLHELCGILALLFYPYKWHECPGKLALLYYF